MIGRSYNSNTHSVYRRVHWFTLEKWEMELRRVAKRADSEDKAALLAIADQMSDARNRT